MQFTIKSFISLISVYALFLLLLLPANYAKSREVSITRHISLTADQLIQQQKLTASDGSADDTFGHTVALNGETAIVGAYREDNSGGAEAGAAYVFTRSGGVWIQQQKLTASDGAASDFFGFSVSVSGDTAVIGSLQANNGSGQNTGAAYVFTRSSGVWTLQQRLQPSDGALNDFFGYSVSLEGDTAVISSVADDDGGDGAGSAYIFHRSGSAWTQQHKLTASAPAPVNFGHSVSLSGNTVLIGAWQDSNAGVAAGAAYVFTRSGDVWTQQQKLTASDAAAHDFFGVSVSLSGDTAVIGAHANDGGASDAGAAYVFTRSGGVWTQQQRLHPSQIAADTLFGHWVSLSGETAVIGAPLDNNGGGVDAGAAYIFTRSGGVWIQQQKLTATDGTAGDAFGFSLALSGNTVLVSAYEDDNTGGVNAGSAYVFVPDVPNAAPVVNAGPDQLATEDVPFNLVASFTDADIADTHIATVNWGDGSPAQVTIVTEPSGSNAGTLNASHTYLASGSYQVTVTVTDAANAAAFDTLQVTVTEAISANYILNTTTQQPNANFNISGNGVIGGNLSVNGALNADGSTLTNLNAANIASGTLDNARLGLISAPNIADSAINTPQIADSAVTVAKIASNQVVKNLNGLTDSVNLQAGENVTITPSGNTLTIAAAGGASQWTSSGSNISYNSGNVGIGSLSPESLLHLTGPSGVAAITINTPGNQRFRFQTLPGIPNWGGLTLNANFQSESGWVLDEPASNGWFLKLDNRGANGASPLNGLWLWRIPPGAGLHTETPQFGVTNGQGFFAGNLGIGTTSPMSKLHVVGDGKFTGTISIDGNVQLNSLGTAGSNHLCRNSFNQLAACSSSYRYKMNIMPFSLGLSLVRRMRPITFDWKADGMNDIGFGAEDVALVEPLLATYNAKGEVEGVKYDRISAVLINAIKEQQAQIEAQQLQLQRQQKLINGLKNLLCKNDPNADVCR